MFGVIRELCTLMQKSGETGRNGWIKGLVGILSLYNHTRKQLQDGSSISILCIGKVSNKIVALHL